MTNTMSMDAIIVGILIDGDDIVSGERRPPIRLGDPLNSDAWALKHCHRRIHICTLFGERERVSVMEYVRGYACSRDEWICVY